MATLTTKARGSDQRTPTWVDQNPISIAAGSSLTLALTWLGATTLATPTMLAYRLGTAADVSGTVLSGSTTVSGNVQTGKVFASMTGGLTYVLVFGCVVDGQTEVRKLRVHVRRAQEGV